MARICLINPPINMHLRLWYPIGIGYIAASLRAANHDVVIIDCIGENLSREAFKARLAEVDATIFGVGGLLMAYNNVLAISKLIRERHPDAFVCAGNTVATTIPKLLLDRSEVDCVVMWEGEETIVELVEAVEKKRPLSDVKGIVYKDGETVRTNPGRDPIKNLDDLPLPAWDLIPMENYLRANNRIHPVSMVRGCPFRCTFCLHLFMGYPVRVRSAQSVVSELEEAASRFDINGFHFMDDLAMSSRRKMEEFCELKMASQALRQLPWRCSGRVNLIKDELVGVMQKSGCRQLGFGFESADQDVLDDYDKRQTLAQMQNAVDICRKYNLEVGSSFLIGSTVETEESVARSAEFTRRNNLLYTPHFVTPFPGTPLYKQALERGLIQDEEAYIMKLADQGHTNDLLINFTSMPDEELIQLREKYARLPKRTMGTWFQKIPIALRALRESGPRVVLERFRMWHRPRKLEGRNWNEWT